MAEQKNNRNYRVQRIDDQEPERLPEDPLDQMPDLTAQTGGLPIVTFVLICLAASAVMLMGRVLTAHSGLLSMAYALLELVVVFGVVALIRGMFRKLHREKEAAFWYPVSGAVMAAGIVIGVIIGIFALF